MYCSLIYFAYLFFGEDIIKDIFLFTRSMVQLDHLFILLVKFNVDWIEDDNQIILNAGDFIFWILNFFFEKGTNPYSNLDIRISIGFYSFHKLL